MNAVIARLQRQQQDGHSYASGKGTADDLPLPGLQPVMGVITDWERSKDCPRKGDNEMDLWVHGAPHISGSRALLIDYTISNPASDTLRGNASAVPQLAANRGHDEAKTARYSTSRIRTLFHIQ